MLPLPPPLHGPGFALNCRGSLPESAAYATALALHQPAVMEAVDRFVTPSRFAAEQLVRLGVPRGRLDVIANYVPEAEIASEPPTGDDRYALVVGRLSAEKGIEVAIEAAARSGLPLRVAGDGPLETDLRALAERTGAPAELLGRVTRERVRELLAGAAMVLVPRWGRR